MSDYINRQAAIDALGELATFTEDWSCHTWMYTDDVYNAIKQLPTIQPEIVRCKDCKHWIPYDWMFSEVWQSKNMTDYPEDEIGCNWCDMAMKADDFCSRADMRGEQDDESRSNSNAQTDTRARGMGATDKSSGI